MRKNILALVLAAAGSHAGAADVAYTFVGSFSTHGDWSAPQWTTNPRVYSGREAAALLFGGNPQDYALSTVDSRDSATITFTAWYDGWGDHQGYELDQDFKFDLTGLGYNGCALIPGLACEGSAYSAYVTDGFIGVNHVWRVSPVPEPTAPLMALAGLGAAVMLLKRRGIHRAA